MMMGKLFATQVVCMMVGVLRASSEYAKANGAPSGPDIFLLQEVTHIGRNVPKTSGLPLPMTLAQVSGKHCQVIGNPHLVRLAKQHLLLSLLHHVMYQPQCVQQPCMSAFSIGVQGA
jgi:hypothetical protein